MRWSHEFALNLTLVARIYISYCASTIIHKNENDITGMSWMMDYNIAIDMNAIKNAFKIMYTH